MKHKPALVFLLIVALLGAVLGWNLYRDYRRQQRPSAKKLTIPRETHGYVPRHVSAE